MDDLTKKKRLNKNDLDMLNTMKTLKRKTTTPEKRNRILEQLTTTPEKMKTIINTWASIRAKNITPRDNKLFEMLKSRYLTLKPKKPFRNIQFEKKFPHIRNPNKEHKHKPKNDLMAYLKQLEKTDKEKFKKTLLKILKT
jgi:hypothetical protein